MEIKEKIYDLTREVIQRKESKAISAIADLKLKFDNGNSRKIMDGIIKKVADKIIRPVIDEEETFQGKVKAAESFLKDATLSLKITEENRYSPESKLLNDVIYSKNYTAKTRKPLKEIEDLISIKVEIEDYNLNYVEFYSKLDMALNKKACSYWGKRNSTYEAIAVGDLATVIAGLYVAFEVQKFMNVNKEMVDFIIAKNILEYGVVKTEEDREKIIALGKKYSMPQYELEVDNSMKYTYYMNWWDNDLVNLTTFYAVNKQKGLLVHYQNQDTAEEIITFLKLMYEENKIINDECERVKSLTSNYARSFEEKKNIPLKVKDKMNDNKLLTWFGKVEIDEMCDLDKIGQIEEEFKEFAEYINLAPVKDNALRFRRLGKIRAAGVYYPAPIKCLCVDIRKPSSFIHELLHLIDSNTLENTDLSSLYNFRTIIELYNDAVTKDIDRLDDNNGLKVAFYGKSKYNKDYFFNRAEIFARCGEIFFRRILKVDNSLLKDCTGPVYPEDDLLIKAIDKYYRQIFGDIEKKEKMKVAAVAIPKFNKEEIQKVSYNIEEDGQLTFF